MQDIRQRKMAIATKNNWETKPAPERKEKLNFDALFSDTDADRLIKGLIPVEMENKWFIYYEDSWLYLHRRQSPWWRYP